MISSVIVGLFVGGIINSLVITSVVANPKPDECGTCDTMEYDPGTFCNLTLPGGGCYSNTGAPCGPNCGL